MRYIDLSELLKNQSTWGTPVDLWTDPKLKTDFRKHGNEKCWYTEVSLAGSDVDIDHFRPKHRIAPYKIDTYDYNDDASANGYYWLKNDPNNYRTSCIYANRRRKDDPDDSVAYGKGCYFPLKKGSPKLTDGGSEKEEYMLLDPCCKADVNLLSFLNGEPVAAKSDPHTQARVDASIDLYHMNATAISDQREKRWDSVNEVLEEFRDGDITEKACIKKLKAYISREEIYSSCAIACIKLFNSLYPLPESVMSMLDLEL